MDKYVYDNSDVLINNFNIRNKDKLMYVERLYTYQRILELINKRLPGNFDLSYLRNIHKYIFQDVYPWAGEIRTVDISKGYTKFAHCEYVVPEANKLFEALKSENYLVGYTIDRFSERLAYYGAELNMLHPFREGNGRTIREFLRAVAENAGFEIKYSMIDRDALFRAFVKSIVDHTELSHIFRSNLIECAMRKYEKEFPLIRSADENLLSKICLYTRTHCNYPEVSIPDLLCTYKNLGKAIDSGATDKDNSLSLLEEIVHGIKRLHMQSKNKEMTSDITRDHHNEL